MAKQGSWNAKLGTLGISNSLHLARFTVQTLSYLYLETPKIRTHFKGLCGSFRHCYFESEVIPLFTLSSLDKDREDTLQSIQDLLEEGGDSSALHSPSRIEKMGETIEERENKTSVRAYQLVHGKEAGVVA